MRTALLTVFSALLTIGAPALHAQGRGGGPEATIKPGEQCPPGMTEIRPLRCMAPQMPAPSILDYRPRSTLVTAGHPVPKAKYPGDRFSRPPAGPAQLAPKDSPP